MATSSTSSPSASRATSRNGVDRFSILGNAAAILVLGFTLLQLLSSQEQHHHSIKDKTQSVIPHPRRKLDNNQLLVFWTKRENAFSERDPLRDVQPKLRNLTDTSSIQDVIQTNEVEDTSITSTSGTTSRGKGSGKGHSLSKGKGSSKGSSSKGSSKDIACIPLDATLAPTKGIGGKGSKGKDKKSSSKRSKGGKGSSEAPVRYN